MKVSKFSTNKKKMFATLACAVALCAGGVLAMLTATDVVTSNVRFAEKLELSIVQPGFDALSADAKKNIIPTQSITMDPAVKNNSSMEAWVFMEVDIPMRNVIVANADGTTNSAADTELFSFTPSSSWEQKSRVVSADKSKATYCFAYKSSLAAGTSSALFNSVIYANIQDTSITGAALLQDIKFRAQGIQITGFATSADAYAELYGNSIIDHATLEEYSLSELKTVANDLAANDTASPYYAKFSGFMNDGATKMIDLNPANLSLAAVSDSNGNSHQFTNANNKMKVRIIGINQDVDELGAKNGLTFMATNALPLGYRMNSTNTNVGGWEQSELRGVMNNENGTVYKLFSNELKSVVKQTKKKTVSDGYNSNDVRTTNDKFFLLSVPEIWGQENISDALVGTGYEGFYDNDGEQYQYFANKKVTFDNYDLLAGMNKTFDDKFFSVASGIVPGYSPYSWWLRSVYYGFDDRFGRVYHDGAWYTYYASYGFAVLPAFAL